MGNWATKIVIPNKLVPHCKEFNVKNTFAIELCLTPYPRYQVIQIVSYDMNVSIVVLHSCRNDNEKMKNINI